MEFVIIFLLFLLNGFFSMSEMALVTSKSSRLEMMKLEKKKGAATAVKMQADSGQFLSAIQVGITLISFVTGFYGGSSVSHYITPLFVKMGLSPTASANIAIVLAIIVITFLAIVIGELVPKTIALSKPEKIAVRVAPIIFVMGKIFYPVVKLLSVTTNFFNKLLGVSTGNDHITETELKHIIKDASKIGVIEEEQNQIHENLFYYSDKKAKHIMTHRSELEWIDINLPEEQFIQQLLSFASSKILVCDKNLDDFVGVLRVRNYLAEKCRNHKLDLKSLLDSPVVFPESAEAHEILKEFKKKQFYFGVVLDEFGSVEGVVTLHDITESIFGEIPEEEDIVEPDFWVREDKSVLVNGDAPIEILLQVIDGFEIDFEEIDYSTVAGFVLENIEKIPEIGDVFDYLDYKIEIVDVDHNRIDKILMTRMNQ
ncbi:hemolysin family protein [Bacteroidales bacterium OttesenSCG-928-B11]|nr:hemolysin family protein [Bacteroidales bacterium OttesenSCG-928-B11]